MFVGHTYVHIVRVDHNKGHEPCPESGRSRLIHLSIFPGSGLDGAPAPLIERSRPSFRPMCKASGGGGSTTSPQATKQ
ncbi:hypothetical protein BJV78DRAFT_1237993 [Lactifluus subvellereus]|nr:hypothetical protein BJV78DRAFT_1237993 [Lactifluus subvellereus]